ncbi:hypothetical protein [Hansschlegelia zhihuaiae]|uniref:Nucleoside 2-deoxyribosyltransferase n=1 Tax=Hansschlegelia zhihuaiae TaxID=405005 RepID=A0A4Q0MJ26_9HYPH|nr:hypothetical protein [Hansschlegelia zhihuaiae]RXF72946.1 hypothetical protein EK403_12430 [Hansschlegelia zhihuaiae]
MFNLIMIGRWPRRNASISLDRMFEYTDDRLLDQFRDGGEPDLDELIRYPCLFMVEGRGDQPAHVGNIQRARISGRQILFDYAIDETIPPIRNADIYRNRLEFDMPEDFEFNRNHWAVKDVSLFRALLRHARAPRQQPTVFRIPQLQPTERSLVSVMMPFDAEFRQVYTSVRNALEPLNLRCRRADEIWEAPEIIQDIVSLIDRSRIVVADCTNRNPNVFYEIGIAHTLGRDVILITQNQADIPFDLRHLRYVQYLNNREGRANLRRMIAERAETLLEEEV